MEHGSLLFRVNSFMQSLPCCVYYYYYELDCLHAGAKSRCAAAKTSRLYVHHIVSGDVHRFTLVNRPPAVAPPPYTVNYLMMRNIGKVCAFKNAMVK